MKTLNDSVSLQSFFKKLSHAEQKVLLLDYDGTLAPFREERDKALPYPGIAKRLNIILGSGLTRLIIISGRWSEHLKPLLSLESQPEIWGCHGAERVYPDGRIELINVTEQNQEGIEHIQKWAEAAGFAEYLEFKPTSIAFHWRGEPAKVSDKLLREIKQNWQDKLDDFGLEFHSFDGGLEIRIKNINKGRAVGTILDELHKETALAYLGDDLTDEDAFRVMNDRGLKVLVRETYRPTKADIWLVPPLELFDFLDRWIAAIA